MSDHELCNQLERAQPSHCAPYRLPILLLSFTWLSLVIFRISGVTKLGTPQVEKCETVAPVFLIFSGFRRCIFFLVGVCRFFRFLVCVFVSFSVVLLSGFPMLVLLLYCGARAFVFSVFRSCCHLLRISMLESLGDGSRSWDPMKFERERVRLPMLVVSGCLLARPVSFCYLIGLLVGFASICPLV